jgi:uncharacterized protein (DUF983 family)
MQLIFAGICLVVFFVAMVASSTLALGGWVKAAIVIPLLLLVVYSLARIQPKETASERETGK